MMEVLDAIRARRSIARLIEPAPDHDELRTILLAAACAPDHGMLRPWRFVVLEGEARAAFGEVMAAAYVSGCEDDGRVPDARKAEKDRTKLDRAPLVVAVGCAYQESAKIPRIEQFAACVAAAQNACLAATGLGFGSMWRTGPTAYDHRVKASLGLAADDDVAGFLYLGTVPDAAVKDPQEPTLEGAVARWVPEE